MGFSDRDYYREEPHERGSNHRRHSGGWSMTAIIIAVNVALWLINGFCFPKTDELTEALVLFEKGCFAPESWYRFLSYGFAHDPTTWSHIVWNMLALAMFGYGLTLGIGSNGFGFVRGNNAERQLGKEEFLAFYLCTIFAGGLFFALTNAGNPKAAVLGASGGVSGVVILYAWLFPRQMIYFWGILPMPMWGLGLLIVVMDASGTAGYGAGGIAYSVHLAGAAFATLYYLAVFRNGYRLTRSSAVFQPQPKPKPRFRVVDAGLQAEGEPEIDEAEYNRRLDEILGRYGEVGERGLSEEERLFLQRASRKYAAKHREK